MKIFSIWEYSRDNNLSRVLLRTFSKINYEYFLSLRAIGTTPAKSYAPKSPAATLDIWQSRMFVLERGEKVEKTKYEKKKTGTRICRVNRGDVKDLRGITYSKCRYGPIFDRAPIEEWFSSRVRGMQIEGSARLYLHTLKGMTRAQPSRGHTAFQESIYVRVSSSDFPIENVHRFARKICTIFPKYASTNWFLPHLIPSTWKKSICEKYAQ